MRKALSFFLVCFFILGLTPVLANNLAGVPKDQLAINSGPTGPGDAVPMVWLETGAYPKKIAPGEKLSLFSMMTSKVSGVSVSFDFDGKESQLTSSDGMTWTGSYSLPARIKDGVHVAHFTIYGPKSKTLNRAVDFFVDRALAVNGEDQNDRVQSELENGWPLKVSAEQAFLADEKGNVVGFKASRSLDAGEKIVGLYKSEWYRVRFEDGTEGWIIASAVEEPAEDFYRQGYAAFSRGDFTGAALAYSKALTISPNLFKARYWLAKTYFKSGNDTLAAAELVSLLKSDPTNYNAAILATRLSDQYFSRAHASYVRGDYQKALLAYQKALELKPSFITAYLELGNCYDRLGYSAKAREAWVMAYMLDPENKEICGLLNIGKSEMPEGLVERAEEQPDEQKTAANASGNIEKIKTARTQKGTTVKAAISDVLKMTRSFGTLVQEKGWVAEAQGSQVMVSYLILQDQSGSGKNFKEESFSWAVELASQNIVPLNKNAKMLMSSW